MGAYHSCELAVPETEKKKCADVSKQPSSRYFSELTMNFVAILRHSNGNSATFLRVSSEES
jgi:hypothetical protein